MESLTGEEGWKNCMTEKGTKLGYSQTEIVHGCYNMTVKEEEEKIRSDYIRGWSGLCS